jgi:hypothetical protein
MNEEWKKVLADITDPRSHMSAAMAAPVFPDLRPPQIPESVTNPAKWMYSRLVTYIKSFEEGLDKDHEIGARLVSFGQSITFHIENIGYHGPDIISFKGVDDKGQAVQLIQHTSQLSVLLIAVKKQTETPRRIGFILDEQEKKGADGA